MTSTGMTPNQAQSLIWTSAQVCGKGRSPGQRVAPQPLELIWEADGLAGMQVPLSVPRDKGHACPPPPCPTVPIPGRGLTSYVPLRR